MDWESVDKGHTGTNTVMHIQRDMMDKNVLKCEIKALVPDGYNRGEVTESPRQ